jgi:integrase
LVAGKIVLKNTKIKREYFSFISPEAYYALKDWMDFRRLHGENLTGESWVMRDTWQKVDKNHGHRIGLARFPQKFNASSIRNMIHEAWKVQGIRDKLSDPQVKRHEFKSTHSFRKIFETRCQKAKMNHNNIKLLMDHSLGESQNYHRPTEQELLEDYFNAVDLLTINDEFRLKKKIEVLEVEKSQLETIAKDVAILKRKYKNLK